MVHMVYSCCGSGCCCSDFSRLNMHFEQLAAARNECIADFTHTFYSIEERVLSTVFGFRC